MHTSTYVFITLLILFIILPVEIPEPVSNVADHMLGQVVIMTIAISLLFYHPALGVTSILAGYLLITRSSSSSNVKSLMDLLPSNLAPSIPFSSSEKQVHIKQENNHSQWNKQSLEEEVIQQMVPNHSVSLPDAPYKPVLNATHGNAEL